MSTDLDNAVSAFHRGDYEEAVDIILAILEAERQNWKAWFYLALCYEKTGRSENAYRILQVIGALCPDQALRDKVKRALPRMTVLLPENMLSGAREQDVRISA